MSSGAEHLAQVTHDFLRLDREPRVVGECRAIRHERLAHCLERPGRLRPSPCRAMPRSVEPISPRAPDRNEVVRIDLGRKRVDVDNLLVLMGFHMSGWYSTMS